MSSFWNKLFRKQNNLNKRSDCQATNFNHESNELEASVLALGKQQKELSINIEYISDTLDDLTENLKEAFENSSDNVDDPAKTKLINSLISLMDLIEDFHAFAASADNPDLLAHAEVLLNSAAKKITPSGITLVCDKNTPPDPTLNTIIAIDDNEKIPDGYITKTLRGGYLYMGEVVRPSQVVVNKISQKENENESDSRN